MTITTGATARLSAEERRILIRYAAGDSPRQIAVDTGIPAGDVALTIDSVAKNNRGLARNIVKEYDDLRGVTAAPVRPAPKPVSPPSAPPAAKNSHPATPTTTSPSTKPSPASASYTATTYREAIRVGRPRRRGLSHFDISRRLHVGYTTIDAALGLPALYGPGGRPRTGVTA
jgi:hypothetical protein